MLSKFDKEKISILYNEDGFEPEEIAEILNLNEIEVANYCLEIL